MKEEISNKAYSGRDRRGGESRLKRRSRFLRNPRIARPVRLKSKAVKSYGGRPFKDSGIGDSDNSFRQTKAVNDWLGRGVLEEYSWPGLNGAGESQVVRNSYNYSGDLIQKEMNSGEKYRYIYNSQGKPEKTAYPDGTYSVVNYDYNGNILKTLDRRGVKTTNAYNKSDMLTCSAAGDIEQTLLHTHYGPASVAETEDSTETISNVYEYHFSGGVTKNTQTIDGTIIQVLERSFDDGGNQTSMEITGSGSGANAWSKTLNIDNQYHSATPDEDHCNKTAIFDGSTPKIIEQTDYLGLLNTLKYGTTTAREVSYTYITFFRLTAS